MKTDKIFLILFILVAQRCYSQSAEVKVNILSGAIAIFNPSIEVGVSDHTAIVVDYVGAYAKDDYLGTGYPFLFSMGIFEYRYYPKLITNNGFFIGGDIGLDQFRMNKNIIPLVSSNHQKGSVDVGYGFLIGATIGYKYHLSRRWNIEVNASGGWHLAYHECYNAEEVRDVEFNATGEWTLYKLGLYLNYKLWR